MKLSHRLGLTAALALLGVQALTAAADVPAGVYVGGDIGRSRYGYDSTAFINAQVNDAASFGVLSLPYYSRHNRADAWWVSTGYMFGPHAGLEASFLHLGELTYRAWGTFTPTGGSAEQATFTEALRSSGPALSFVYRIPLSEALDVQLRVGDYYGRSTLVEGRLVVGTITYQPVTTTARSSSLLVGLGAAYTFDGHWSAKLDYLRVNQAGDSAKTGKFNTDVVTVGASYTF